MQISTCHQTEATNLKEDPLGLMLLPERFEAQMRYLSFRGFATVTLDEATVAEEKNCNVDCKHCLNAW